MHVAGIDGTWLVSSSLQASPDPGKLSPNLNDSSGDGERRWFSKTRLDRRRYWMVFRRRMEFMAEKQASCST